MVVFPWLTTRARRKRKRDGGTDDGHSAQDLVEAQQQQDISAERRAIGHGSRGVIPQPQQTSHEQQPLFVHLSRWRNISNATMPSSVDAAVHHVGRDPAISSDKKRHGNDAVGSWMPPTNMDSSDDTFREKMSSAEASVSLDTTTLGDPSAPNKLMILPLVPQHVQQRRRLAEIMAQHQHITGTNNKHNISNSIIHQQHAFRYRDRPRPSRYPRRRTREQRQSSSNGNDSFAEKNYADNHRRLGENPDNSTTTQQQQQQKQRSITGLDHQQVVGLYQGFGTHYVDLWVGTPPQRQTLIVDTGSATTAFPCSACTRDRCGPLADYHTDPPFQEQWSSTFAAVPCGDCVLGRCRTLDNSPAQCTFGVSYQEGSNWTAFEAMDQVYVGGMHTQALERPKNPADQQKHDGLDPLAAPEFSFPLRFGCQTQMTGHFRTQLEDGIVGMDIGRQAIWNQMYLQGRIASRAFSLCFQRHTARHASGALTLGGTDPRLHNPDHPMVYAERVQSDEEGAVFFSARLRRVYLREGGGNGDSVLNSQKKGGGDRLKIIPVDSDDFLDGSDGLVIIDSGTTDTYLTRLLRKPFQQAWLELTGGQGYHNKPVAMSSEDDLDRLPTILLQFQGHVESNEQVKQSQKLSLKSLPLAGDLDPEHPYDVLLAIPPSHYMEYQPDTRTYIAGFYFDEPEGSVLGANAMMMHDILFDIEHERIGWAESTCEYNRLVAPFMEHVTDIKNAKTYHAPNPRMRGPPGGRTKTKDEIANPIAVETPVGGGAAKIIIGKMGMTLPLITVCSSAVCRTSLAVVTILLALGSVVALSLRRRRRRACINSLSSCTLNNAVHSNGTSIGIGNGAHVAFSVAAAPPRRGGKRRSSNLTRSTSEAIPRSALVPPGWVAVSSDEGGSSNDDSIPSGPRRFTRGQVLRSRSNCNSFSV